MESSGYIRGVTASLLGLVIVISFAIYLEVFKINLFPSPFDEGYQSFEQSIEQREMISALKESMPLLAKSVLTNPNLDDSQVESLRLLYLPLINDFVDTGEPKLIQKAQAIKDLIINGELRASIDSK